MKAYVHFDSSASSYEIQGELHQVRALEGVKDIELLRRVSGEAPMYCLEIEVEDAAAPELTRRIETARAQYSGYVSNLRLVTYQRC